MFQESRVSEGEKCRDVEQSSRNLHWNLSIEPCRITDVCKNSAGVAVGVKSHIGMHEPPGEERGVAAERS